MIYGLRFSGVSTGISGGGRVLPLDAIERLLKAAAARGPLRILDDLPSPAQRLGGLAMRPGGPVGVGVEQKLGPADLLAGPLNFPAI